MTASDRRPRHGARRRRREPPIARTGRSPLPRNGHRANGTGRSRPPGWSSSGWTASRPSPPRTRPPPWPCTAEAHEPPAARRFPRPDGAASPDVRSQDAPDAPPVPARVQGDRPCPIQRSARRRAQAPGRSRPPSVPPSRGRPVAGYFRGSRWRRSWRGTRSASPIGSPASALPSLSRDEEGPTLSRRAHGSLDRRSAQNGISSSRTADPASET